MMNNNADLRTIFKTRFLYRPSICRLYEIHSQSGTLILIKQLFSIEFLHLYQIYCTDDESVSQHIQAKFVQGIIASLEAECK